MPLDRRSFIARFRFALREKSRNRALTRPQATTAATPDPGGAAAGRLWTLSRQSDARRRRRRLGEHLQGRARRAPRRRAVPRGRLAALARVSARAGGERPLGGEVRAGRAR